MNTQQNGFNETLSAPPVVGRGRLDGLSDVLYRELRRIAAAHLRRERPGHTLQPTALVHEAYMRLAVCNSEYAHSRSHFLALAATVMRQLLVHHARRRGAVKRGGGQQRITLEEGLAIARDGAPEVLAIHAALEDLARTDERKSRIIELRYFGGLSDLEIAEVLNISLSTVSRQLKLGLAILHRSLHPVA